MIPYTYLLHHKPTGTFYYGARWAKDCSPNDFWIKYYTSSKKLIPLLRTLFGDDSFEFEIRRTFDDKLKARDWEFKVLRRMKVLKKPHVWLNRTDNKGFLLSQEQVENQRQRMLGKRLSKKTKERMSLAGLGKQKSIEHRKAIGSSQKGIPKPWMRGRKQSDAHKRKNSEQARLRIRNVGGAFVGHHVS